MKLSYWIFYWYNICSRSGEIWKSLYMKFHFAKPGFIRIWQRDTGNFKKKEWLHISAIEYHNTQCLCIETQYDYHVFSCSLVHVIVTRKLREMNWLSRFTWSDPKLYWHATSYQSYQKCGYVKNNTKSSYEFPLRVIFRTVKPIKWTLKCNLIISVCGWERGMFHMISIKRIST